jgi:predicted alpha/beta superfamily hydrolase
MRNKKPYRTYSKFSETLNRKVTFYFFSNIKADEEGPLLIMHDGQNLFDDKKAAYGASWGFIEAMNHPDCPRLRVLGISNTGTMEGRIDEYSPFSRDSFLEEGLERPCGGKGDLYLSYLMNEVYPHYQDKYPISKLYMGGSSMGGIITLSALLSYPNQLDGAFGLSNAWWFSEEALLERIHQFKGVLPKFYMDTGSGESDDLVINEGYLRSHENIRNALSQKSNRGIKAEVIEGGKHFETYWADRLLSVLIWLID